jgi:Flp pilus assembly protein TadG
MRQLRSFLRVDLGQSIVELALALPLMTFLLVGGADVARAYAIQIAVQNGARAGAEASAIDFTPTGAEAVAWTQQEMGRTPGMDSSICQVPPSATTCTITVTRKQSDGTTDCLQTPSVATPCFFTVRVQYRFRTIIPWPLVPNQFDFDRKTMVRTFV